MKNGTNWRVWRRCHNEQEPGQRLLKEERWNGDGNGDSGVDYGSWRSGPGPNCKRDGIMMGSWPDCGKRSWAKDTEDAEEQAHAHGGERHGGLCGGLHVAVFGYG